MPVDFDMLFGWSNNLALTGWLALILLPHWKWLTATTGIVIPALLGVLYGGLAMASFATVEGGGFGSIDQVRALFSSDAGLLAGWVHYLAFDLAIGTWIARRADEQGLSRLVQTPILLATFLFGPLGFLLHVLTGTAWKVLDSRNAEVAA